MGIEALLLVAGIASSLGGCGGTKNAGSRILDAATAGIGGGGGIGSGGTSGTNPGSGGIRADAGASKGGNTGPGTGGSAGTQADAAIGTGGMGGGGTGAGGSKPDGGASAGGVGGTTPDARGGGGGTTSLGTGGVGSGGVAGSGGTAGADASSPGTDTKLLSCEEIPGPCTSTTVSNFGTPAVTTSAEYAYDDLGRPIRVTYASSNGSRSSTFSTYDEAGRLLERKTDSCDTPERIGCYWHTYVYDDQGNLLVDYDTGNSATMPPGCTKYTYNAEGLLVRREFFAGCGSTSYDGYVTFEYDNARRLIAEHSTQEEFLGASANIAFEYDDANRVSRETYTNKAGTVTATVSYTRNAAGQTLLTETRYPDGSGDQIVFTYNARGNELGRKTVVLSSGKETRCFTFTYDSCGKNLLTYLYSENCDGATSTQTTYSYACFGGS
ncbi:MAG: hypothetical protein JXP73_07850 [Deltaproteobacteria bacterium]|nr:hypothetical protein [Deltaproteobacteria bacterium]